MQQSIENTFVEYKVSHEVLIGTKGHNNHLLPGRNRRESTSALVSAGQRCRHSTMSTALPAPRWPCAPGTQGSKTDLPNVTPAP